MGLLFWKKDGFTYDKAVKWLDEVLKREIPEDVRAFCFNLYNDGSGKWSMELVGVQRFDRENADWPCEEITDFGTRENSFVWKKTADWSVILEEVISALTEYIQCGKYAEVLTSGDGVGVGFVDGDVTILYDRNN